MSLYALKTLLRRWKLIFLVGFLFAALSALLSLLLPFEYRADAQVLIISQSRFGVDPYTVVKSAERIGENIVQVMRTDDFFNKVIEQEGYTIDQTQFEGITEQKKRKKWQEIIAPSVIYGTGLLNVSAYHTDPEQALEIAGASVDTLVNRGWEYVGGDVIIRVVNQPIVSKFPVRPNIAVNIVIGFFIGVLVMSFAILRKARKKSILHRW